MALPDMNLPDLSWLDGAVLAALVATVWTLLFSQADRIVAEARRRRAGGTPHHVPPRVLPRWARLCASALRRRPR